VPRSTRDGRAVVGYGPSRADLTCQVNSARRPRIILIFIMRTVLSSGIGRAPLGPPRPPSWGYV